MEHLKFDLVTGIFPPDIGGPATFIPQLASFLTDRGYEVKVLTLFSKTRNPKIRFRYAVDFTSRELIFPVRTIILIKKMVKSFRKTNTILANGLYLECALANLMTNKTLICKIVGDPVWERYRNSTGSEIEIEKFNVKNLRPKWRLQRKAITWSLNRADLVITPSEQLRRLIMSWGVNTEIQVIPNGTKCSKISEKKAYTYDVASVSRLVNWKNIDVLIKACALNQLSLAIAGSGPEETFLKEIARKFNARVTFKGHLNEEESRNLMAESRIFALISSYEGMSFTLLEAMMLGKRILVSGNIGNRELIESNKTGVIVDKIAPKEVADALKILNKGATNKLGKEARRKAKDDHCLEKILYAYEREFQREF